MRDSGCPVPDYMLEMKRLHKNTRRKLEKKSVARDEIRIKPHRYQKYVVENEILITLKNINLFTV